ncbi:MAG: STAS domain-containing protein [Isosphaeraceae bacterium]
MTTQADRQPIRIEVARGVTVVHLLASQIHSSFPGHYDAEDLKEKLNLLIDRGHVDLVLDMGRVEYTASMFLGVLFLLQRRLVGLGGRLRICSLQPSIQELFGIARIKFELHPDLPSALAS